MFKFFQKLYFYFKYFSIFKNRFNAIVLSGKIDIENKKMLNLGRGIYFGNNLHIMNRGLVTIEDNVIFAPNVTIIDYNHNFKSMEYIPYSSEDIIKPVIIKKNVWIGYGTIILPGSFIEEGVIISAGSVVKGRLEKNSIYMGNPIIKVANRINNNKQKQYMFEKLSLI